MARRRSKHPGQDDFFEPPEPWKLARIGDPSTSRAAAARITPEILIIRGKTLWWYRLQWPGARTLLDLENRFNNHKSSYRTRNRELVNDGLLLDTGREIWQEGSTRKLWIAAPWWMENELSKPGIPEDTAERKKWWDERMALYAIVMAGIQPWRAKHQEQSHREVIECPACKGRLHLNIATNCRVHGKCETEGCVEWME